MEDECCDATGCVCPQLNGEQHAEIGVIQVNDANVGIT
jgi:hypothetical protein